MCEFYVTEKYCTRRIIEANKDHEYNKMVEKGKNKKAKGRPLAADVTSFASEPNTVR